MDFTEAPRFPSIKTKRLRLRNFTAQDIPDFVAYRQDPDVARYQSWDNYTAQEGEAFFIAQQIMEFGIIDSWYQIAIANLEQDRLIGDCVIHFLDEHQVEIGFTLAPGWQGKGYMTEALSVLVSYIFSELHMHRITALTDAENISSCNVLERVGFREEAHYRKNIWFKGKWGDEKLFAMLEEDWEACLDESDG